MSTMKASVKGKYDVDKNTASSLATFAVNAGDAKIKLSATEATFSSKNPSSLQDLTLSLEKPGQFIIDYYVPRNVSKYTHVLFFSRFDFAFLQFEIYF